MPTTRLRPSGRVLPPALAILLLTASTGSADPVLRRAAGATPADIQTAVDQFRTDLGGANNGVGGSTTTGRREINWDAVPVAVSSPNSFPADFFNVNSPRGAVFSTIGGGGFQVSGTPPRFGNFNPAYETQFTTFSPQKLFAPTGSFIMDVTFRIPGTSVPATVSGFGVVFTDVDVFGPTKVEFFNERGQRIGPVVDSTTALVGAMSFVGVSFSAGVNPAERLARVRITSGDATVSLGVADISNGGASDVVVMDDFIYGEPQPMTGATNLDTTFDADGQAEVNFGFVETGEALALQPDGKIVVVGTSEGRGGAGEADLIVIRYTPDGARDTTFNTEGRIAFSFGADLTGIDRGAAVAIQPDGKIVVVGSTDAGGGNALNFAVARLNADGTFDTTFNSTGKQIVEFGFDDQAHAVAIQPDGKIVVVGQAASDIAVLRLRTDGSLDPQFNDVAAPTPENGDGRYRFSLGGTEIGRAVALAPDGSIFIAGRAEGAGTQDFVVVKLTSAGAINGTFGTPSPGGQGNGAFINFSGNDAAEDLVLLADGRIVVGGTANNGSNFGIARLLPTGLPDLAFNGTGSVTIDFGGTDVLTGIALQSDGRVVLAGFTSAGGGTIQNLALARVTTTGQPDPTFATNGRDILDLGGDEAALDVAVQTNGRLVLSGRRPGLTAGSDDTLTARLVGGPPPVVTITTPSPDRSTTATVQIAALKGTAADLGGVARVTWTSNRGFSGNASGTTDWFAEVPLLGGTNIVTVTATGPSGVISSDAIVITVSEFVYFLSEGATGDFFDMDILVANPTDTAADVQISYLKPDGTTVPQTFSLGARTRRTVKVEEVPGLESTAVSAVVRSTNAVPLAVERTMFWDATYYGGHTGNAVDAPRTRWLFGEGSQGFFDTYVLLGNANTEKATVTVTFLVEGAPNVVRTYDLAPTSRFNVYAGIIPELNNRSFSIVVTSTLPIIAERAMYFGKRLFEGGHESAGVAEAATSWFHAEGATGSYFDTWILVGNPNPTKANLTVTFLKGDGTSLVRHKEVPPNGRYSLFVDGEDPALADTAVSTTVVSDIPVVSERAMYWPGTSDTWFEAHNSFGVTGAATKWALAEGRVGGPREFETFVLLANPGLSTAQVRATFLRTNGTTVVKTYDVLPTSRFNIWVNSMVPELANEDFGVLLEVLNGVDVAVERAMYWTSAGVDFAGGTNATAVRVP